MADRQYLPLAEPFPAADTPLIQPPLAVPLPRPRLRLEGLSGPPVIALPFDLPIAESSPMVSRRPVLPLGDGTPFSGQADAVTVPDLTAMLLVSPLPRPRPILDSGQPILPILAESPFPGDLATTVVQGTLPCAIIPSGMTPGDDSDG